MGLIGCEYCSPIIAYAIMTGLVVGTALIIAGVAGLRRS